MKIEVARKGGVRKTYGVKLQALPAPAGLASRDAAEDSEGEAAGAAELGKLGVTVAPVGREDVARFQLSAEQRGLLVTDVRPGGPSWGELVDAERGGPDIILEVERKPVKTVDELRQAIAAMKPGEIVSVRVYNPQAKTRRIERIRLGE